MATLVSDDEFFGVAESNQTPSKLYHYRDDKLVKPSLSPITESVRTPKQSDSPERMMTTPEAKPSLPALRQQTAGLQADSPVVPSDNPERQEVHYEILELDKIAAPSKDTDGRSSPSERAGSRVSQHGSERLSHVPTPSRSASLDSAVSSHSGSYAYSDDRFESEAELQDFPDSPTKETTMNAIARMSAKTAVSKTASRKLSAKAKISATKRPKGVKKNLPTRERKDEIRYLKKQLQDANMENGTLKSLQQRQERRMPKSTTNQTAINGHEAPDAEKPTARAIQKLEGRNADLPVLISQYGEELRVLREQLRNYRERAREQERILRDRNDALVRTQLKASQLEGLLNEKGINVKQHKKLTRQHKDLEQLVEERDTRIKNLERHIELLTKNHRHQLNIEISRHKATLEKMKVIEDEYIRIKHKGTIIPHSHGGFATTRDVGDLQTRLFHLTKPEQITLTSEGQLNDSLRKPIKQKKYKKTRNKLSQGVTVPEMVVDNDTLGINNQKQNSADSGRDTLESDKSNAAMKFPVKLLATAPLLESGETTEGDRISSVPPTARLQKPAKSSTSVEVAQMPLDPTMSQFESGAARHKTYAEKLAEKKKGSKSVSMTASDTIASVEDAVPSLPARSFSSEFLNTAKSKTMWSESQAQQQQVEKNLSSRELQSKQHIEHSRVKSEKSSDIKPVIPEGAATTRRRSLSISEKASVDRNRVKEYNDNPIKTGQNIQSNPVVQESKPPRPLKRSVASEDLLKPLASQKSREPSLPTIGTPPPPSKSTDGERKQSAGLDFLLDFERRPLKIPERATAAPDSAMSDPIMRRTKNQTKPQSTKIDDDPFSDFNKRSSAELRNEDFLDKLFGPKPQRSTRVSPGKSTPPSTNNGAKKQQSNNSNSPSRTVLDELFSDSQSLQSAAKSNDRRTLQKKSSLDEILELKDHATARTGLKAAAESKALPWNSLDTSNPTAKPNKKQTALNNNFDFVQGIGFVES